MKKLLLVVALGACSEASSSAAPPLGLDVTSDVPAAIDDGVTPDGTPELDVHDPGNDVLPDLLGGDDTPSPLDVADPDIDDPTAPSYCQRFAKASCGLQAACPLAGLPVSPDCEAAAYAECGGDGVAEALQAGTATLVGADACLDALASLDCATWQDAVLASPVPVPECAEVVSGAVIDGGPCRSDAECASGRCEVGASCPGTCVARPPAPDAVGEACGAATVDFAFCALPLTCGEDGTCVAPGGVGAGCDDATPCAPWLTCFAGSCALYRAPGESCFTTAQCDPAAPGPRLVCSGGVCTPGPAVGAPCTEFVCGSGYCDTAALPPTCVAAPSQGAPCAGGGLCGDGLRCVGGTCAPPLAHGASCESPAACESFRCVAGTCVAPGASPCPAPPI